MRRANIIAGSIFVVLAVYIMYEATLLPIKITGSGLGPGVVPFYLAGLLGVLALLLILHNLFLKDNSAPELEITKTELTGLVVVFFAQTLYIASISYLGFGTATVLFVAFLSNLLGKYAWWKCCLVGIVVAFLTVLIFRNILGLPLQPGLTGF